MSFSAACLAPPLKGLPDYSLVPRRVAAAKGKRLRRVCAKLFALISDFRGSNLICIRRSSMGYTYLFVPLLISMDPGKGDIPTVREADFRRQTTSSRHISLFPCVPA
jgi:hypothetical protein